jgi:hypothetical protein
MLHLKREQSVLRKSELERETAIRAAEEAMMESWIMTHRCFLSREKMSLSSSPATFVKQRDSVGIVKGSVMMGKIKEGT